MRRRRNFNHLQLYKVYLSLFQLKEILSLLIDINTNMESSKIMMAHVTTEIIVIGAISFFFHKKISNLNQKIEELEKKIAEKHESNSPQQHDPRKFEEFRQQTTGHINNIYSLIRQLTETYKNSQSHPQMSQMTQDHRERFRGDSHVRERRIRMNVIPLSQETNEKLEVIEEDEQKESPLKEELDEELDEELEDELKKLSEDLEKEPTDHKVDNSSVDTDTGIIDIKNDDDNTITETPLEFIPTKGKKLVKKRK